MKINIKSLFLIMFFSFSIYAISQQSKQPIKNPPFRDTKQQADTQKQKSQDKTEDSKGPVSMLPIDKAETSNKIQDEKEGEHDDNASPPYSWRDVFKSPPSFFTGAIAFLTFFLVIAGGIQVVIARDTERRQLRAYVFIDSIAISNVFGQPPSSVKATNPPKKGLWIYRPKDGPIVVATIRNSGQTPAYDLICAGNLILREYPAGPSPFPHCITRPPTSKSSLAAKAMATQTAVMKRPLKQEELDGLISGKYAIYYCGTIFYRDAFNKKRQTRFRHFYNNSQGSVGLPNVLTACGEGNEAD